MEEEDKRFWVGIDYGVEGAEPVYYEVQGEVKIDNIDVPPGFVFGKARVFIGTPQVATNKAEKPFDTEGLAVLQPGFPKDKCDSFGGRVELGSGEDPEEALRRGLETGDIHDAGDGSGA